MRAVRLDFPERPVSSDIPLSAVSVFWFRLLHFQNKLGFEFEKQTKEWIIENAHRIKDIEIFKKYGFDPNVLGAKRRNTFTERLKKQTQRVEGFKDTRKDNSGRPSTKELSLEEQIERLKHKNKVLQQENDFLKRVRFINRKQITKKSKNKQ